MNLDNWQAAAAALVAIATLLGGSLLQAKKALRKEQIEGRRAARQEKLDSDAFVVFHAAIASLKSEVDWVRLSLDECHERETGLRDRVDALEARADRQETRADGQDARATTHDVRATAHDARHDPEVSS